MTVAVPGAMSGVPGDRGAISVISVGAVCGAGVKVGAPGCGVGVMRPFPTVGAAVPLGRGVPVGSGGKVGVAVLLGGAGVQTPCTLSVTVKSCVLPSR
ncbi:MAG: hypothetical protein BWY25_01340 [Chloroflexi bacterium ADurb.Bin222]|nr:MAG: hypothetical protein BWY25_01340 [Chloroflexi bacterium ADurb.Bin222]